MKRGLLVAGKAVVVKVLAVPKRFEGSRGAVEKPVETNGPVP